MTPGDSILGAAPRNLTVYAHLGHDRLIIPLDRLELCLRKHEDSRRWPTNWVTPLGLLLAVAVPLFTADFRRFVVAGAVWEAVHVLLALGFLIWTAFAFWRSRTYPPCTIEQTMEALKEGSTLERTEVKVSKPRPSRAQFYNERPAWLALVYELLDAALLDAYGWPHDISDEDLLARMLALNLEREPAGASPRDERG